MKLSELETLIKEYKLLSKGIVDANKYAYYAMTHHSTSIEGSTLTESQVINLLEDGKPTPNKPFEHHQMVYDHYKALLFVIELAKNKEKLSPILIQKIASEVMKNTGGFVNTIVGKYDISKGEYRLSGVRAGNRLFPDYKKVPELMTKLCNEVNAKLKTAKTLEDKCQLAFKIHFDFVSIHPFGDGNGRTARLLMNYIQTYFDIPLSIVFKQNKIKYVNTLELAIKKDDLQVFYDFMFSQYFKFLKKEIKEMKKTS